MERNYLFADFLKNEASYLELQCTWRELLAPIAAAHGYTLTPYMNLAQAGRPVRDGNPIVALRVTETGQGIRILQTSPTAEGADLWAWFDRFGADDATEETPELVIDLKATPTTLAVAAILIEHWIAHRLDPELLGRWLAPWSDEEE
jgi:hypothetical protein